MMLILFLPINLFHLNILLIIINAIFHIPLIILKMILLLFILMFIIAYEFNNDYNNLILEDYIMITNN